MMPTKLIQWVTQMGLKPTIPSVGGQRCISSRPLDNESFCATDCILVEDKKWKRVSASAGEAASSVR